MATALEQLRYIDEQLASAVLPPDQSELVRVHRLTGLQLRSERMHGIYPTGQAWTGTTLISTETKEISSANLYAWVVVMQSMMRQGVEKWSFGWAGISNPAPQATHPSSFSISISFLQHTSLHRKPLCQSLLIAACSIQYSHLKVSQVRQASKGCHTLLSAVQIPTQPIFPETKPWLKVMCNLAELGPAPPLGTAEYEHWDRCKKNVEAEVDMTLAETRLTVEGLEESWDKWYILSQQQVPQVCQSSQAKPVLDCLTQSP